MTKADARESRRRPRRSRLFPLCLNFVEARVVVVAPVSVVVFFVVRPLPSGPLLPEIRKSSQAVNEGVDLSVFPFSQASFFQRDSEVVVSSGMKGESPGLVALWFKMEDRDENNQYEITSEKVISRSFLL